MAFDYLRGVRSLIPLWAILAGCGSEVHQPVGYNHDVHVNKLQIGCDNCHAGSMTGQVAGLPTVSDCADCHAEANGTSDEEKKVVEAVKANRPLVWQRLYSIPSHVFFTHRRHVQSGGIACERCHGLMKNQKRPPPAPLVALTMTDCINCHRERGVSTDCTTCHR